MKRKKPLKRGASKQSERTRLRVWGPPGYREWIESMTCTIGGPKCGHPVDAHHSIFRSHGGTWRDLVPLCRRHHNGIHTHAALREQYKNAFADLAAMYAKKWESGLSA